MDERLQGKIVVITGASSGIGAATARLCGAAGMRVVLGSRRTELLEQVAEEVRRAGGETLVCRTDVAAAADVERLIRAAEEHFGHIDILLANAGAGYSARMAEITEEQILRTVQTNLLGVIRLTRAALPMMIARRSGHVITVSSVAGGFVMPRAAVYAATKAGIHRFTEGLRREVREYGIHVSDVMPGIIDTPMTSYIRNLPKAPVDDAARAMLSVMRRPRRCVVVPGWYRVVLALNRHFPALMDAAIARMPSQERRDPTAGSQNTGNSPPPPRSKDSS